MPDDPQRRADLLSGLCAALALVDKRDATRPLEVVMTQVYQQSPDGGTRSAAMYALKKWKVPLPKDTDDKNAPTDNRPRYVNSQGMTMVLVPAGKFEMGSISPHSLSDERQVREVTLTADFYLAVGEVTGDQFQEFLNDPGKHGGKSWEFRQGKRVVIQDQTFRGSMR